jgi:hypothetical protein
MFLSRLRPIRGDGVCAMGPVISVKIQELPAAPESLVKKNEILRNKQMRSASNGETDGDFGDGNPSRIEARSRFTNENVRTMEERIK